MITKFLTFCGYTAIMLMFGVFFVWALFLAPISTVM